MAEQGAAPFPAAVILTPSAPQDHHLGGLQLAGGGFGDREGRGVWMVTEDVGGAVHTAQIVQQAAQVNAHGGRGRFVVVRQRSPAQWVPPQLGEKRHRAHVVRKREHDMRTRGGPGDGVQILPDDHAAAPAAHLLLGDDVKLSSKALHGNGAHFHIR
ncbi:hypothetical protein ACFV42_41720 [Streptomyces solisilvae]|uniref:hypothetical protein n=1 Tax=Streptomyces malaysiensis TaxID=92644 RepID=UPI0036955AA2